MRNLRHVWTIQRRVAVIGSSATERIVFLREQLKHELIRSHTNAQQNTVVSVIRRQVVVFRQLKTQRNLASLMSARSCVHIFRGYLSVGFV